MGETNELWITKFVQCIMETNCGCSKLSLNLDGNTYEVGLKIVPPLIPKDKNFLESTLEFCLPPSLKRSYIMTIFKSVALEPSITHSKDNNMGTLVQF
jgi:hypothetical protein